MAKKQRTNRGRNNSGSSGSVSGGNGKPRARRRRRGGTGGGSGVGGGSGGGNPDREPADIPSDAPLEEGEGILELHPNGYGFLRSTDNNYSRERSDPFVPGTMIERFGLRQGVHLKAMVQEARRQQGPRVREILDVDGMDPEKYPDVRSFENQTPINPEQWLRLEVGRKPLTNRVIDLLAPMGKGQRALIVSPPRSGKTVMLQDIATGISTNHPDLKLMVLLIDERPEEVTDMQRTVKAEVISSTFDEPATRHVQVADMVIAKAKRLVEHKRDVVILLDSITRLARAHNTVVPHSGKILSGGVDSNALHKPKRFFGAARNVEEGGSLTIVGTALIETGSRMDEVIFEEFKGTGNSELVLDRKLADRRTYPAIDITRSATRREELLLSESTLNRMYILRKVLAPLSPVDSMEFLLEKIKHTESNEEFLDSMNS